MLGGFQDFATSIDAALKTAMEAWPDYAIYSEGKSRRKLPMEELGTGRTAG